MIDWLFILYFKHFSPINYFLTDQECLFKLRIEEEGINNLISDRRDILQLKTHVICVLS